MVLKLNATGQPDNTFGTDGMFTTVIDSLIGAFLTTDNSGGVIVAYTAGSTWVQHTQLMRLTPEGQPDPSFGPDGSGSTGPVPGVSNVGRIHGLADGGMLLEVNTASSGIALVKCGADGVRDMSFGTEGKVTCPLSQLISVAGEANVLDDGRIFFTGSGYDMLSVSWASTGFAARFLANGLPDTSFAENGVSSQSYPDFPGSVFYLYADLLPDGSIYLGGMADSLATDQYTMARTNAAGVWDTAFAGTAGPLLYGNGNSLDLPQSNFMFMTDFAVLPNGKPMSFATYGGPPAYEDRIELIRYAPNGSLDPTFGDMGHLYIGEPGGKSAKLIVQPDGKLLACGMWLRDNEPGFGCVRLAADDPTGIAQPLRLSNASLSVFPNPAHGHTTLQYTTTSTGRVALSLMDGQGRMCQRWGPKGSRTIGAHHETLDLPASLAPGLYYIELKSDQEREVAKLRID